jgi:hypothetical protein
MEKDEVCGIECTYVEQMTKKHKKTKGVRWECGRNNASSLGCDCHSRFMNKHI